MRPATAFNSALDNPRNWIEDPLFEAPEPAFVVRHVQDEIDSIVGLTRDNQSIARVVWAGDRTYWKKYHTNWTATGQPVGPLAERPQLLWKTITEKGQAVRDIFPHRWMLVTRIEPEQFVPLWKRDSRKWCNERNCWVQVLPETPPSEYWLWYMTIAEHDEFCCQQAASRDDVCYGRYAHPRACIPALRDMRRGLEVAGVTQNDPFASPDVLMLRMREQANSNYAEQAIDQFVKRSQMLAEEAPLAFADAHDLETAVPLANIRERVIEDAKRAADIRYREIREQTGQ